MGSVISTRRGTIINTRHCFLPEGILVLTPLCIYHQWGELPNAVVSAHCYGPGSGGAASAWIHRRDWRLRRVATHECPSDLGRWDLSRVLCHRVEGHPLDAIISCSPRDFGAVR